VDAIELRDRDLCFIDIETTGSVFAYHEIIDLGAIRTSADGSVVKGTWERRMRPKHPERMTGYARELSGYTDVEWQAAQAPSLEMWQDFARFASSCIPICHNPPFERAFITLASRTHGVEDLALDYHWIGTESLGWPLYRSGAFEKLSLDGLCKFVGIETEPRPHHAIQGARACCAVYRALMAKLGCLVR
jgi:DNA polymerase III alpha subunit (gram-positive type)